MARDEDNLHLTGPALDWRHKQLANPQLSAVMEARRRADKKKTTTDDPYIWKYLLSMQY
jgi:hypothetical protein